MSIKSFEHKHALVKRAKSGSSQTQPWLAWLCAKLRAHPRELSSSLGTPKKITRPFSLGTCLFGNVVAVIF
jgi:hypothetical protein